MNNSKEETGKDQIQFETNGLTVLACRVPESERPCHVYKNTLSLRCNRTGALCNAIGLPGGKWKLSALTDKYGITFYGKVYPAMAFVLRSHGIDPAEKWVLLVCE